MINWIRRKLHNFILQPDVPEKMAMGTVISARSGLDEENEPMRFSIYNASGGKIVEIRSYDQKRDRWDKSLHIITSDEDFGESIGKIAFVEMLKRG